MGFLFLGWQQGFYVGVWCTKATELNLSRCLAKFSGGRAYVGFMGQGEHLITEALA